MSVPTSIHAYFEIVPRTFRDGVRLYVAYALSALLRLLLPSHFGFVGRWVPGRAMLGVSIGGVRFDVRPGTNDLDLISSKHEPATTAWFTIRPGDVFIDAGAHIGRYALRAAAQGAKVLAIEPDPSNFQLLERNVALNGFRDVTLIPGALSAQSGMLPLRLAPRENTGMSRIEADAVGTLRGGEFEWIVPVAGVTLDELVKSLGFTRIDWLKIDVEGHEVAVLRGAVAAMKITKNLMLEVTEATRDSCRAIVESGGFELLEVEAGDPASNWLFRRTEEVPIAAPPHGDGRTSDLPDSVHQSVIAKSVSIGICAYNEAARIQGLLEFLSAQRLPPDFSLAEIVVVASGCTDGTVDIVRQRAQADSRCILVEETERRGKASALNLILNRFRGDVLVLVNADARLSQGSIRALLDVFSRKQDTEIACGFPIPEESPSRVVSVVEETWWRLHNRTLQALATLGRGNHCCDELMAMKRGFLRSIPGDIICDGSYFGVSAAIRGTTVQLCPDAVVFVDTPSSLFGLLKQRRRNLRGHWQVARLFGEAPYTLELLTRRRPALAAQILLSELLDRPLRTIAFLVIALPLEFLAHSLAHLDGAVRPGYQPVWPMVE